MPVDQNETRDFDPRSSAFALFAHKMRRYRERDGLSQHDVGAACTISPKLVSAIENLRRLPSLDASQKLDHLHEADFFEDQYHQILRESRLTPGFRSYAEQEDEAGSIHDYAPLMIPGLFQSEAYVREVLRAGLNEDQLEEMVAVRLGRQDILERDRSPFLVVLIKEAVLREPVGGPEVMREQLTHLIELGRRPQINIQVIPAGAPPYISGAFTILGFAESGSVGYVEAAVEQGHLIEPPATVHRMLVTFDQIRSVALPASETERLIRSILEDL